MGKAGKRKRYVQTPASAHKAGPSPQALLGLGLALAVVIVIAVLQAVGSWGWPGTGSKTAPSSARPLPLDTNRIRVLEEAVKANPSNKAPMVELGNLYYDAQRYAEAIPWYARALELDPADTNVRTDMATAYFYTGDVARAIEEGRRVLSLEPDKPQANLNMGIWLVSQSPPNTAEAIRHWQKVIDRYPDTKEARQAQELINKYR